MRALAAALLLAGCVGAGPAPVVEGPVVPLRYDVDGIEALGTGQRIDFGRDRAGVLQTMTRLQGASPTELPCDDPANRAYRWRDGPVLIFRNGAFAGWRLSDPARSADGRMAFGAEGSCRMAGPFFP